MSRANGLRFAFAVALLFGAGTAGGSGLDQLRAFVDGAKSGKATFRQVVTSRGRLSVREAAGTFTFLRP
jgi:outer membrane lipoprotein-sorting protein